MFKRTVLGAVLALTLAGGALTAATLPVAAAPVAAAQALPVAQLAFAPSAAQAVQLSTAQLAEVSGDGLWSRFKKWVKKVVKKVVGVIVNEIIDAIKEWLEEWLSDVTGGDKQEQTETTVQNFASQADYDAGIVSYNGYEDTGWYQTEQWYGSYGGGGGCGGSTEYQLYQMDTAIMEPCYMY
jgi:hypothetical protein